MTLTTTPPTLLAMEEAVYQCNLANGWFEDDRTIGEDFALIHSEIAEALEAYRSWGIEDATRGQCKVRSVLGDHIDGDHLCKPEGVGSELADIVVRILDTVHRRELDLSWETWAGLEIALEATLAEVSGRPLDGESFGDHIEQLHVLTAKRDLGGLLGGVVYMADRAGLDLQAEFDRKLAYNRTRGHKHGGKLL